jgi:hypothetical protein
VLFRNRVEGKTSGFEIAPVWTAASFLRLKGAYSFLNIDLDKEPGSGDQSTVTQIEGSSPRHQLVLQSFLELPRDLELDLTYRYVSELPYRMVDDYHAADVQLSWAASEHLRLSFVGRNLLDANHVEFTSDPGPNGWAISSAEAVADESRRIEIEANSLFELLETQVVPLYPTPGWTERMIENLRTLGPFVSAHRMVRDYVQDLYLPAATRALDLESDGYSGARQLAAYRARLDDVWHLVHVDEVSSDESAADLGALREVTATVALGELHPDEVEVQLVCGHVGQSGELESPTTLPMTDAGEVDDRHRRFTGMAPLGIAGRMGVTVRVVPRHPLHDTPAVFGRGASAE